MDDKNRIEFTFYPSENNDRDSYTNLIFETKKDTLAELCNYCRKFALAIGWREEDVNKYFEKDC